MNNLPLVSVCIISYNSSKTILETLNSILAQTYSRLELVISDDKSTDNTVSICQEWIKDNGKAFESAFIISQEKNVGIPKNLNTAISAASGEWVKPLAGDDLLLPNCIQDNVSFILEHDFPVVFSKVQFFKTVDGKNELLEYIHPEPKSLKLFSLDAASQNRALMDYDFIPPCTFFTRRDFALANPFPEQYRFFEDFPQWFRLTKKGQQLVYFDKMTAMYRISDKSIAHASTDAIVSEKMHDSKIRFFFSEYYDPLLEKNPSAADRLRRQICLGEVAILAFDNRKSFFSRALMYLLRKLIKVNKAI